MLDLIYAKTDAGRRALQDRAFTGSRAQRSLLIMIDGVQTLARLWPAIEALGLGERDVQFLAECGYVEARAVVVGSRSSSTARAVQAAVAATPAAAPRQPTRSLAAAKFYALEQMGRLLGRADEELRVAARTVTDRASLVAWLERCAGHIATVAGEERAASFAARVSELMPEAETA